MTTKPSYVTQEVKEEDVTIDWFFGAGHVRTKVVQLASLVLGWFFVVLPVVITASSLRHRDDPESGWWGYQEGFDMWDRTIRFLAILTVVFIVGFLVLHLVHRVTAKERNRRRTYDEQRLAQRLEIAESWYADKLGPEHLRRQQRTVRITPYNDVETYELRGLYRTHGVD